MFDETGHLEKRVAELEARVARLSTVMELIGIAADHAVTARSGPDTCESGFGGPERSNGHHA